MNENHLASHTQICLKQQQQQLELDARVKLLLLLVELQVRACRCVQVRAGACRCVKASEVKWRATPKALEAIIVALYSLSCRLCV